MFSILYYVRENTKINFQQSPTKIRLTESWKNISFSKLTIVSGFVIATLLDFMPWKIGDATEQASQASMLARYWDAESRRILEARASVIRGQRARDSPQVEYLIVIVTNI